MNEIEINTNLFYKELNGSSNPKLLINFAQKGIFLDEPLFKYNKIKTKNVFFQINILKYVIKVNMIDLSIIYLFVNFNFISVIYIIFI